MAKLTNPFTPSWFIAFNWQQLSKNSDDDFHSGCQKAIQYCQQQFFLNFLYQFDYQKDCGGNDSSNILFILYIAITPDSNPLLFPCGNLRRETIPTAMAKAGTVVVGEKVFFLHL